MHRSDLKEKYIRNDRFNSMFKDKKSARAFIIIIIIELVDRYLVTTVQLAQANTVLQLMLLP